MGFCVFVSVLGRGDRAALEKCVGVQLGIYLFPGPGEFLFLGGI